MEKKVKVKPRRGVKSLSAAHFAAGRRQPSLPPNHATESALPGGSSQPLPAGFRRGAVRLPGRPPGRDPSPRPASAGLSPAAPGSAGADDEKKSEIQNEKPQSNSNLKQKNINQCQAEEDEEEEYVNHIGIHSIHEGIEKCKYHVTFLPSDEYDYYEEEEDRRIYMQEFL